MIISQLRTLSYHCQAPVVWSLEGKEEWDNWFQNVSICVINDLLDPKIEPQLTISSCKELPRLDGTASGLIIMCVDFYTPPSRSTF